MKLSWQRLMRWRPTPPRWTVRLLRCMAVIVIVLPQLFLHRLARYVENWLRAHLAADLHAHQPPRALLQPAGACPLPAAASEAAALAAEEAALAAKAADASRKEKALAAALEDGDAEMARIEAMGEADLQNLSANELAELEAELAELEGLDGGA